MDRAPGPFPSPCNWPLLATYEEWLFSGTLDDLQEKLDSKNTYQTLMVSGLLRKLLLDGGTSLLHRVNAIHRLKVRFLINEVQPPAVHEGVTFWGAMDGFDPETSRPGRTSKEVSLDQFLAVPVLFASGETFTVHDVVLHLAHVMGGVHTAKPQGRDLVLWELVNLNVGGAPAVIRSVHALGRIAHRALTPVRQAIVAVDKNGAGEPT